MSKSLEEAEHDGVIRTTANNMGWTGDALNEISQSFVEFAGQASHPVLDIGAAYGLATLPALEVGAEVIANDISATHLAKLQGSIPAHLLPRLTLLIGRFPEQLSFADSSLGAVHASQVLHFLDGAEIKSGLSAIFRWLQPGGRLFVLMATPYQAVHASFIPEFELRKAAQNPFPGYIEHIRKYNTHWSANLLPESLLVFDDGLLTDLVRRIGYVVKEAKMYSRRGLPDFCRYDGRENLALIAEKPRD